MDQILSKTEMRSPFNMNGQPFAELAFVDDIVLSRNTIDLTLSPTGGLTFISIEVDDKAKTTYAGVVQIPWPKLLTKMNRRGGHCRAIAHLTCWLRTYFEFGTGFGGFRIFFLQD
ncbi:unnamed protein product [Lepeophtheirus salmonis]|uniref:(salmon louse) hypothetical protein n=1 Tax=Lepeophtheirus salmonis TaxID=72036 RepID=A0A7R8CRE6_LEPSM|nr:unnamed protein product [Lepeophtheirus salmonis]CAF2904332.1 unnamed protein product [Lepeophtheirus salmonis]